MARGWRAAVTRSAAFPPGWAGYGDCEGNDYVRRSCEATCG
eukprot:gene500-5689_t